MINRYIGKSSLVMRQLSYGPEYTDPEIHGPRRLLKTGLIMCGIAATVWLSLFWGLVVFSTNIPAAVAQLVMLTSTVLLWPMGTLGLVVLLCWLFIQLWEIVRSRR
jgi:hypothetical protein